MFAKNTILLPISNIPQFRCLTICHNWFTITVHKCTLFHKTHDCCTIFCNWPTTVAEYHSTRCTMMYNFCTLSFDKTQLLNIIPQLTIAEHYSTNHKHCCHPLDPIFKGLNSSARHTCCTIVEHYSAIDDCDHTGAGDHSDHQLTPTPSPPIIDRTAISSSPPHIQKCIKRCTALCWLNIAFPLRITHCWWWYHMFSSFTLVTKIRNAQTHYASIFQLCICCVFLTIGKLSLRYF